MKTYKCHSTHMTVVMAAMVLLTMGGCDEIASDFYERDVEVAPEEVIDLTRTAAPNALPADGTSTDTMVARIPFRAASRVVTFTTTGGVFEVSAAKEVKVRAEPVETASGSLEARAVLRTDTVAARVFVRATVSDYSDTLQIMFVRP